MNDLAHIIARGESETIEFKERFNADSKTFPAASESCFKPRIPMELRE